MTREYLPKDLLKQITMLTLCSNCNKEFECRMCESAAYNFSNCPHCGERNDRWVLLVKREVK